MGLNGIDRQRAGAFLSDRRGWQGPLLALVCGITLLVFLAGWGKAAGGETVVLRVANWGGAEEVKSEQAIADEFARRHPGVVVRVESIPASNYKEKILAAIAAGSPPDVFLLDSVIMPTFINRGLLLDLMPFAKARGIDLSMYFPNVLKIGMRDSALYAFPKDSNPIAMYYNRRLFDAAGVPYPRRAWTWDDYLELAKKLTKDLDGDGRIDQFGTAFSTYLFYWQPFVWMNKGDILSPDGTRATGYLNSPATEEAIQFLIDLRVKHQVAPHAQYAAAESGGITRLFFTGRIGMVVSGHWLLTTIQEYMKRGELEVGVAPLPTPLHGEHVTVMYEAGWCVPKGTSHPELAMELAAFMGGKWAGMQRIESLIAIPAIVEVAQKQAELDPFGLEQVFLDEVPFCRQPWGTVVEQFRRVEELTKDAVDLVLYRGWDLHAMLTDAARKIDKDLADARSTPVMEARPGSERGFVLHFLMVVGLLSAAAAVLNLLLGRGRERRATVEGYAFLAPSFAHLLIFVLAPLVFSLYLSVHRWDVIMPTKPFVGLDNYRTIFTDRLFLNALKNTALYSLQVPVAMGISLAVALMMNQRIKGVNLLRTLYFLPSVSSFVAIAMVWQWLYEPQFGLINYLLRLLGLGSWSGLSSPNTALISLMVMTIWMQIGYQMVIFLAGLQGIPDFLYEAAIIDGATAWQRFRRVTLPLLKPTTFFILVTAIIGSFQVFTSVWVMTQGGPARATDVVVYHIYQNAWEYLRMGRASAMAWVLFSIILVITLIQFRLVGRRVEYS